MKLVTVPDIDWRRRLLLNGKGGAARACSLNVRLILENDPRWEGVIAWDAFAYKLVKQKPPPFRHGCIGEWEDADTANLIHWVAEHYGFEPHENTHIKHALLAVATNNAFHPVRDYLDSLRWDGVPRVDDWLTTYLGASDSAETQEAGFDRLDYLRLAGRKWLIAAVARVMGPPAKVDNVLILEGQQGTFKSTAFRVLAGQWFTDSHFDIGSKDGYQHIRGVWIVEMPELDSLNKAEATRAKAFFGSETDRYRASYGSQVKEWPRQCVICGTTNQDAYLKDSTGGRRYWPVRGGRVDLEKLASDRDQLWAEALHYYREGVPWWVTSQEARIFRIEQEERYNADAWESLISDWLEIKLGAGGDQEVFITMADVFKHALEMEKAHMRPPEQQRVGNIMQRLGWRRRRRGTKSARSWGWIPPDVAQAADT